MMKEFDVIYSGRMHYFLDLMIIQSSDGFFISQRKFQMEKCFVTPVDLSLKLEKDPDCQVVD